MTTTFLYHAAPCSRVALLTAKTAAHLRHQVSGISLVLKIAVILCLIANVLPAETFGKFTYIDYGTEIAITDYPTTEVGAVEIPSTINGKPVTIIDADAFRDCGGLTSIVIPNSVHSVQNYAFKGCGGLTTIVIPDSVAYIGFYAFDGCTGMTSAIIGNSVPLIEPFTFNECTSLTSVTLPNSVTSIGAGAFGICTSLTSITIPDTVTSIGDAAFILCSSLTSISIPDSVTDVGFLAFLGCSSLASITIPDSVISIGHSAFSNCTSLTSITIPNGVPTILESTFSGCSSLTSAAIGSNVQAIGTSAFEGCSSLTSITIPVSVSSISDFAFRNCNSLSRILFAGDAPSVGTGVFLYSYQATVFYLPKTTGWKSSLGTRPTALWLPPVITNQPASVIVNPGESATFGVTASAIAALPNSYQWQKNGIAIPGAVNSSLSLTGIQSGNVGNYTVVISNHAGSSVSAVAALTLAAGNLYTQAQYDAALQMGFDLGLQVNDSDVLASPNTYDLYRLDQIQEIHVGTPLLEKDPVTGSFKMTIKAQKSTALSNFAPFPFTAGDVSINPEGNLEFQFTPAEDAAFFRLGVE